MLDSNLIDVYAHLWYDDTSIHLLEKIGKMHRGKIHISLNEDGVNNDTILNCAEGIFEEIETTVTENSGSDQLGFYKSYKKNKNSHKPFVMYMHDKRIDKIDWLDDLVDPLIENLELINKMIKQDSIGIISSGLKKTTIHTEDKLVELDKRTHKKEKKQIVLSRHTLAWLRELQYILYQESGIINKEVINFDFCAGNMFIARSEVVENCHSCVHPTFFGDCYREDGNVEHAMERLYYYVSLCLNYENKFL